MNTLSLWLLDLNARSLSDQQRATHTHVIGQPGYKFGQLVIHKRNTSLK